MSPKMRAARPVSRREFLKLGGAGIVSVTLLGATGCSGVVGGAQGGSDYPSEDIEFIVPYSPGGGYDTWARLLAPFIEEHLPNSDVEVIVRNVPGADGRTAASQMYAAEPDGSQIQIFNLNGLAAGQLAGATNFELREFTYLGQVTRGPQVLYVAGDSEIENVEDLREAAPVQQAITGFTSNNGVNTVILYEELGIEYSAVLHDGSTEASLSVIRGDTDAAINSLSSSLGDFQSGDLKPILYASTVKPEQGDVGYEQVRDVQALADVGLSDLGQSLETKRVIAAPPELPEEIRQVLSGAILDALNDPEFRQQAEESELTPAPLNAQETTEVVNETLDTISEYEEILTNKIEG